MGYRITQELVFDTCVKDIVESVLHGYNGSIIASGQTGKLNILNTIIIMIIIFIHDPQVLERRIQLKEVKMKLKESFQEQLS